MLAPGGPREMLRDTSLDCRFVHRPDVNSMCPGKGEYRALIPPEGPRILSLEIKFEPRSRYNLHVQPNPVQHVSIIGVGLKTRANNAFSAYPLFSMKRSQWGRCVSSFSAGLSQEPLSNERAARAIAVWAGATLARATHSGLAITSLTGNFTKSVSH
jgi:hypothetical protein